MLAAIISLAGISVYKLANTLLYKKHLTNLNTIIVDLKSLK
jgi:hypothetical protein